MQSLQQAFLHFPGIGPVRRQQLLDAGIDSWQDILPDPPSELRNFASFWDTLYSFAQTNIEAEEQHDWLFFTQNLKTEDRWRLLHHCWDSCVYLDIETEGIDCGAPITVISCWDGKEVKLFVKDENLDDFPDYLLTVPFLVTFNGASFDLPVIKRQFNLPDITVPHVDMRWVCYNCDLSGGLKAIERKLQLQRPQDLVGTDGNEAILLWNQWQQVRDKLARNKLLRYCAADTIALKHVTAVILRRQSYDSSGFPTDQQADWSLLDKLLPPFKHKPSTVEILSDSRLQEKMAPIHQSFNGLTIKERLERVLLQKMNKK